MTEGTTNERECTCPDADTTIGGVPAVQRFEVAPVAGGGWDAWSTALHRLLQRLTSGPTQCVVVSQGADGRYVQWMIGHDRVHVEVSSNHYLTGTHRLAAVEEQHLWRLGFRWVTPDDDTGGPLNWVLEIDLHDHLASARLAAMLTHLAEDVVLFDPRRPITIEQFLATHPCAWCTWGDPDDRAAPEQAPPRSSPSHPVRTVGA